MKPADVPEHFECIRCGRCCEWSGDVRLTEQEIDIIAQFLKIGVDTFLAEYTRLAHDRKNLSLIEKDPSKHCIFYTDSPPSCLIQPVKPQHCRDFPYLWRFPDWEIACLGAHDLTSKGSTVDN